MVLQWFVALWHSTIVKEMHERIANYSDEIYYIAQQYMHMYSSPSDSHSTATAFILVA